jgi:hypothetical protein
LAPWFWPYAAHADPPTTDDLQSLTADIWQRHTTDRESARLQRETAASVAREMRFFHWELEFPEVFERGGFHAIVGNPPWETLSPETKEFFANLNPLFREYGKQRAVGEMKRLRAEPAIEEAYRRYSRRVYQLGGFLKTSGIYTWYAEGNLAKGDLDLFRSFVERDFRSLRPAGRMGQVLKEGIYLNSNCTEIRKRLLADGRIVRLIVNENRKGVFPIHSSIKVVLLVAERGSASDSIESVFFVGKNDDLTERALTIGELKAVLANPERSSIRISLGLMSALSPGSCAFLEIRDSADVALLEHLRHVGVPFGSAWEPKYCRELDMTNDSNLFVERGELERLRATFDGMRWSHPIEGEFWPLVEGRSLYQYEFPVGTFRYWVNAANAAHLPQTRGIAVNRYNRLVWRHIASSTNERTIVAAVVEARSFCGNNALTIRGGVLDDSVLAQTCILLNSFVFDWQARIRGATSQNYTVMGATLAPAMLSALSLGGLSRIDFECNVLSSYALPFDLAEHVFKGFPLLDRLEPPLEGERRSTITRDLVLAAYSERLGHPKGNYYRERADRAEAMGARPFVPATRVEEVDGDDEEDDV